MHLDFVEESYWKRVSAIKLAKDCKNTVLRKFKESKKPL